MRASTGIPATAISSCLDPAPVALHHLPVPPLIEGISMHRSRSYCVVLAFALVAMCSLIATSAAAQEEGAPSLTREGSSGAGAAILNLNP